MFVIFLAGILVLFSITKNLVLASLLGTWCMSPYKGTKCLPPYKGSKRLSPLLEFGDCLPHMVLCACLPHRELGACFPGNLMFVFKGIWCLSHSKLSAHRTSNLVLVSLEWKLGASSQELGACLPVSWDKLWSKDTLKQSGQDWN